MENSFLPNSLLKNPDKTAFYKVIIPRLLTHKKTDEGFLTIEINITSSSPRDSGNTTPWKQSH